MNKMQLIDKMAEVADITKADAKRALDALLGAVQDELVGGGDINLVGFGRFQATNKSARTGRNPQTGETLTIAARKSVKFTAGKTLKDAIQ